MIALSDPSPVSGGTLILSVAFADEVGAPVIPSSAVWTLTDADAVVVNGQSGVAIAPAASVDVVLKGDDLPAGLLYWSIRALYDSDAGSGLIYAEDVAFYVQPRPMAVRAAE